MCGKTYRNSDGRQRGISECGDGIDGAAVRGVPAEKKMTGAEKSSIQRVETGKGMVEKMEEVNYLILIY